VPDQKWGFRQVFSHFTCLVQPVKRLEQAYQAEFFGQNSSGQRLFEITGSKIRKSVRLRQLLVLWISNLGLPGNGQLNLRRDFAGAEDE